MSHIETHLFSICPKPGLPNAQPTFQRQNIFQILATQQNQLLPTIALLILTFYNNQQKSMILKKIRRQ